MAGADSKRTGVLDRLRNRRERRRQQHAEKARIAGELKRESERSGRNPHGGPGPGPGAATGGGGGGGG
jgi:hypothetical protein